MARRMVARYPYLNMIFRMLKIVTSGVISHAKQAQKKQSNTIKSYLYHRYIVNSLDEKRVRRQSLHHASFYPCVTSPANVFPVNDSTTYFSFILLPGIATCFFYNMTPNRCYFPAPSTIALFFHFNDTTLMKTTYFLHKMIKRHFTLSPYPIRLAMMKPVEIFKITLKGASDDNVRHREKRTGHSGPLIMRSRRWKYFSNGEFYWLYSRRQPQGGNGLAPNSETGMQVTLKKWAQSHVLPSKLAIRQAEGFHG